MKKILQKSLASMVSAALCLTAFVGCLTVNAAEYAGTISSAGTTVSETATEAKVTLTLSSPNAAMNIAAIAATTDFGTLTDVAVEGDNCKIDENKNLAEGRFYVDAIANEKGFTTAAVILTFTKAEGLQKGNYPVTITYFANKSAATWNEDIVNLTVSGDINITVTSATTDPVLDENITCTFGAGLSTTPYLSFVFNNSELAAYDSFDLVVTRNTNDTDFSFKEITSTVGGKNPVTGTDNVISTPTKTYYYYYGIELYSLNVPVNAVLYCKDADGNVVAKSNTITTTLKEALVGNYEKTTNNKVKTAIADLIVAAAEVQKFVTLSVPNSDYATKLALPTEGFDTSLATVDLGQLASYNTANNGTVTIAPGAAVGSSPYLSFNMDGIDASELSSYNLKISYYDQINKIQVSKNINLASEDILSAGSKYYAYFYDMAIYATNAEVTAELYKGEATSPVSTYSYSFDTFISARMTNPSMGSTLIALGKLGQSFRAMNGL